MSCETGAMRLPTKRKIPISKDGRGTVTLEAALVMPVFVLAVLFLVYLIQTAVAAMALHGALSQTVRQAAAQWYPISLGLNAARETDAYKRVEAWEGKLENVGRTLSQYGSVLPSPVSDWAEQAADGSWSPEQIAARQAFAALLEGFADKTVLDESRISVTSVGIPGEGDGGAEEAFLTVEAEYRLPMRIPFLGRSLKLTESARERAWIGGSPSSAKLEDGDETRNVLSFVSLEPNPVSRGRKATLTLRTEPGAKVDLSVIYKSGLSQAKHLGTATADDSGLVKWTWHVSGNTTPGEWAWEARPDNGAVLSRTFEVVRPARG